MSVALAFRFLVLLLAVASAVSLFVPWPDGSKRAERTATAEEVARAQALTADNYEREIAKLEGLLRTNPRGSDRYWLARFGLRGISRDMDRKQGFIDQDAYRRLDSRIQFALAAR